DGISFSSARFSAYAFLLLLITPTICVFVIVLSFTLSMIACRFVPPPDTITTTRSGLSAAAPVLSSIILLLCLLPQCVPLHTAHLRQHGSPPWRGLHLPRPLRRSCQVPY